MGWWLEWRVFSSRSRNALLADHAEPGLWIPRGKRSIPEAVRPLAAGVDEAADQDSEIHVGIRPGIDAVPVPGKPQGSGLRQKAWERNDPGGQQSFEFGASRGTRPESIQGQHSCRDVRQERIPSHR